MKKIERLIVRSTVIFTKKPTGSWLTENEPYIVEANGGETVHFRNPVTGGGTYDQAWAIEQSEFTVSSKARENGQRYAVLTASNAAVAVERKGQGHAKG